MLNADIIEILKEKKIVLLENDISFKSEEEKIIFLNKLEEIIKKEIKLEFLNQDLIEIILKIDFCEEIINKFKKINWVDFNNLFKKKNENDRSLKIYSNFLKFIKNEFNILENQQDLLNSNSLLKFNKPKEEKIKTTFNKELFKKYPNFNYEKDLKEKTERFELEVLFNYTKEPNKITINNFILYFNRRLQYFTNLLKNRVNIDNVMRISSLRDINNTNTEVSIIGLISEINQTKNGHYMITIEDRSGSIKCFVNKDKTDQVKQIENFCLDEGIGVVGKIGNKIIWTDEFVLPLPQNNIDLKRTDKEEYIAVISDLHFGAKVFVDEAFQKFLDFIGGNTNSEKLNKLAQKIKHILIPGDMIEGIGIYPGQGQDARILSAELQYHEAARWLNQIPKDKSIIIIPGNHDTTRLSEPQPHIPYDKAYALYNLSNVIMLSNPSRVNLFPEDSNGGLEAYLYHGGSLFYYADKIQHLRELGGAKKPEEVVKYLLSKKHLAPSHGATLYIPDTQNDPLVIKKMPDFFITGHTHKMSLANHKGCTIISGGCWVEMSDYQEKMGMFPDVGKCILVNTKTRKPKIINFYTEKHNKDENK